MHGSKIFEKQIESYNNLFIKYRKEITKVGDR